MNQQLINLFNLEKNLSDNNPEGVISCFKDLLSAKKEAKITLTKNPGIVIYAPSNPKNLDQKKHILIVIHELSRTGAPVVAVDTAKTLVKNGFFVTVVTMRRGPLLKELIESGIPVITDRRLALTHDSADLLGNPSIEMPIDTILESFDKAIVITAVYHNLIRRCSNVSTPILWWLHEGTATYDSFAPLMPQKLPKNVKVYTGGKYALEQLKAYGLPYNAKILNYGVTDTATEATDVSSEQSSNPEIVSFILPGSIGIRKGQQILLDAIDLLPEQYLSKSKFLFIGDISSEYDIDGKKTKARLISASQKYDHIDYLTSVSREELFKIYQTTDILVLPSLDDPMPVVATETLMLKKVVLCSTTTGTSYYLKDNENGFVFESDNPAALCDKIKYVIDHKNQLKDIGAKGRKVYERHFEMGIFEHNLLNTIKELS